MTTAEEVLRVNPDGVFLSNGPGDPAALAYSHEIHSRVSSGRSQFSPSASVIGCSALPPVGKTFKLKFGHRGGNQPVKDLRTGQSGNHLAEPWFCRRSEVPALERSKSRTLI